jgi:hypothetical protein
LKEVCLQKGLLEQPLDKSSISSKNGLFETLTNVRPSVVAWKQSTSSWLKTHGKDQLIKAELSKSKLQELRALYDLLDADGGGTFQSTLLFWILLRFAELLFHLFPCHRFR